MCALRGSRPAIRVSVVVISIVTLPGGVKVMILVWSQRSPKPCLR
jgi:hypothetical protein